MIRCCLQQLYNLNLITPGLGQSTSSLRSPAITSSLMDQSQRSMGILSTNQSQVFSSPKSAVMLRLMNQVDEENMKVFFINHPKASSLLSNVSELKIRRVFLSWTAGWQQYLVRSCIYKPDQAPVDMVFYHSSNWLNLHKLCCNKYVINSTPNTQRMERNALVGALVALSCVFSLPIDSWDRCVWNVQSQLKSDQFCLTALLAVGNHRHHLHHHYLLNRLMFALEKERKL